MPTPAKIDVTGLRALRKAFAAAGTPGFNAYMAKANHTIAKRVIDAARPGIAAQSSRVAAAVTAMRSAAGARIKIDHASVPWAAGVIFGAGTDLERRGPSGRVFVGYNQFRHFLGGPYHIWPELDQMRDAIADAYQEHVQEFLDRMGVPK